MTNYDREFRPEHIPLAYSITFRTYGSWLHGRGGSVDRFHNKYGSPRLPHDKARLRYNRGALQQAPVNLNGIARRAIELAIHETCRIRGWSLWAVNVRTNHVHTIVFADCGPGRILTALKANATREMRAAGCWWSERSPWASGGSHRYLWTERALLNAIAYVMYEQGEDLPE
jgi:REP element-mobilizing transposase RayT